MLLWLALGLLACREDRTDVAPPPAAPTVSAPRPSEFDAYARGASAEIRLLRHTLQAGDSITWPGVDSVGARAAGLSIERFHALSARVESALRAHAAPEEMQRLDSLRVELMVLRVRAEARHE